MQMVRKLPLMVLVLVMTAYFSPLFAQGVRLKNVVVGRNADGQVYPDQIATLELAQPIDVSKGVFSVLVNGVPTQVVNYFGNALWVRLPKNLEGGFVVSVEQQQIVNDEERAVLLAEAFLTSTSAPQDAVQVGKLVLVSSASFKVDSTGSPANGGFVPGSIVTAFYPSIPSPMPSFPQLTLPLPLRHSGNSIVTSPGGESGLFYLNNAQANFLVSPTILPGTETNAWLVTDNGSRIHASTIFKTVPFGEDVFTADSNGKGIPAAVVLRVLKDGTQQYEPIFRVNPQGKKEVIPIKLPQQGEQVFLVLFGTGWKASPALFDDASKYRLDVVSGASRQLISRPVFAGTGSLLGVWQANIPIPASYPGPYGEITVQFFNEQVVGRTNAPQDLTISITR